MYSIFTKFKFLHKYFNKVMFLSCIYGQRISIFFQKTPLDEGKTNYIFFQKEWPV